MAKFKSLKESRWTRFRAFLRGVLLYNTVYWRRASDEVDRSASRLGRTERERQRPRVDPELLRPRVRPTNEAAETTSVTGTATPEESSRTSPSPRLAPRVVSPAMSGEIFGSHLPDAGNDQREGLSGARRKRRVMRRRELHDKAIDPGRVLRTHGPNAPSPTTMGRWWRWLLGWHH